MKKEKKRYILAEHVGIDSVELDSLDDYKVLLEKFKKLNSQKNSQYLYGNICYRFIDGKYCVVINKYNKLTSKMEITNLDNITSEFETEEELKEEYKDLIDSNDNNLSIIYLESKNKDEKTKEDYDIGIKWIPVLYKGDKRFFDREFMRNCINYYANSRDCGFFLDLVNKFLEYRICEDELIDIRIRLNEIRYLNCPFSELGYRVNSFYDKFIVERNKDGSKVLDEYGKATYSRRRQRDFIFFVKNFDSTCPMKPFAKNSDDFEKEPSYIDERIEREEDFILEEQALAAWDKGLVFKRKLN